MTKREQEQERVDLRDTDWDALDAMTDEEVERAALTDSDCPPMTNEQLRRLRRAPDVKAIRERLGLSQSQFAERFDFSVRTVQEWEQGRCFMSRAVMHRLWEIEDML